MVVLIYYRHKLSLVDITEIMAFRNVYLSHETVHRWVQIFGAGLAKKCRKARAKVGSKWRMDITYCVIKVHWYCLYLAIDKAGNLVDVCLSETRDKEAAIRFFKQCRETTGVTPNQITTDEESGFSDAIQTVFAQ